MAILIRRGLLSLFDKRKLRPGELAITTDGTKLYYCYSAGNAKEVVTVDDLQNILDAQPEAYHALQELISELNDNTSLAASMLAQINQNKSDIEAIQSDLSGYWELNPGTQLTTGQDLNDLMTPGVYYSPSSSITSTLLNTPDGVSPGFRLVVETSTELSYIHQIIIPHQTASTLFLRIYSPDTTGWRAWQKLLNQDDVINVLTSTVTDKPLSAAQGKVLQDNINAVNNNLAQKLTLTVANGFSQVGINASELTGLADLIAKIPFNTILTVSVSDSTLQNTLGLSQYGVLFILKLNDNRNFAEYYDVLGNFYWATNHSNGLNGWFQAASHDDAYITEPTSINGTEVDANTLPPGHYCVSPGVSTALNWPKDDSTKYVGTLLEIGKLNQPSQNRGYRVQLYFDNKGDAFYRVEWWGSWNSAWKKIVTA